MARLCRAAIDRTDRNENGFQTQRVSNPTSFKPNEFQTDEWSDDDVATRTERSPKKRSSLPG
jgi:hypothetical protein